MRLTRRCLYDAPYPLALADFQLSSGLFDDDVMALISAKSFGHLGRAGLRSTVYVCQFHTLGLLEQLRTNIKDACTTSTEAHSRARL